MTPVELLQQLIRFDTTNPPGNEAECIAYVRALLEDAGCAVDLYARDPARPNAIPRWGPKNLYGEQMRTSTPQSPTSIGPCGP